MDTAVTPGRQLNKHGQSNRAKKRKRKSGKPKKKSLYSRFLNAMHSRATTILARHSNMISFGIMTAILVAMTCVVHYDLLGLFPVYPFRWHGGARTTDDRQPPPEYQQHRHHHGPVTFERNWLPRPGTDPGPFRPQLTILVDDYDDKNVYDEDGGDSDRSQTPAAVDGDDSDRSETPSAEDDDARWSAVHVEDEDENDADAAAGKAGDSDERPTPTPASCPLGGGSSTAHPTATKTTCSVNMRDVDLATDTTTTQPPEWPDSGDENDDDYVAPGQERDDVLF